MNYHYFELTNVKARYYTLQGSKDAGKSYQVFLLAMIKFLAHDWYNIACFRQTLTSHRDTTRTMITKMFNVIKENFGIDPDSLIHHTKNPYIWTHIYYHTEITTHGFDTNNIAKLQGLERAYGYYGEIIYDEPVEEAGQGQDEALIERKKKALAKVFDTCFRGRIPQEIEDAQRVSFMFNPWTADNEVKELFIDPYIVENEEILVTKGKQIEVVEHEDGRTNCIMITNYLLNRGYMTTTAIAGKERLKETNPRLWKSMCAGMTSIVSGAAFANILHLVEWFEDIEPYKYKIYNVAFGIDYAQVADKIALVALGYTREFDKEITFGECVFNPKRVLDGELNDEFITKEFAKYIVNCLHNIEFPVESVISINVDNHGTRTFKLMLKKEIEALNSGYEFDIPEIIHRRQFEEAKTEASLISSKRQAIWIGCNELKRELRNVTMLNGKNFEGTHDTIQARHYGRGRFLENLHRRGMGFEIY